LSDEVVRTTTQFLLGVGKVLRDVSASASASAGSTSSGGALSHLRNGSMEEEAVRRLVNSDAASDKRSSDGRQSRETRRSWDTREPTAAMKEKLANIARTSTPQGRPSSALHSLSRGSGGSNESRSNGDASEQQQQQTSSSRLANSFMSMSSSSANRRFYAPREKRTASDATSPRNAMLMSSVDSQETVLAHEPSPTPAGRQGISLGARSRTLVPLAIPPSLSTLPSESLLDRASASPDSYSLRKVSTNSNLTVRAEGPSSLPSVIKPPGTTTAVSTASADSPPSSSSFSRTQSRNSGGGAATTTTTTSGVTFSRPSTLSALSGLQQQYGSGQSYLSRTGSSGSVAEAPSARDRLVSGSETERARTVAGRGRASLDAPRSGLLSTGGQSSTVNSVRRERRRTITEIFGGVSK
jgi:hypothetical protein